MSRGIRFDKFFLRAAKPKNPHKGKRVIGINHVYHGDRSNLTLQDLLEFLKEKKINPAEVFLSRDFTTFTP